MTMQPRLDVTGLETKLFGSIHTLVLSTKTNKFFPRIDLV